jgi:hypothetical protein
MHQPSKEEEPMINPVFVIDKWCDSEVRLKLNNKTLEYGKDYYTGYVSKIKGTTLVKWLKTESTSQVNISITRK